MNNNQETKKMDFSAIATKYGVKCSDGLTIDNGAFAHQDGQEVPMVFQHNHNDINNVIGHCELHSEDDGIRLYGYLNEDVSAGRTAKALLQHGDIKAVSVFANGLTKNSSNRQIVTHGNIKEVSIVLSPANPGAVIDYVAFSHADGSVDIDEDSAYIFNGFNVDENSISHAEEQVVNKDAQKSDEIKHDNESANSEESVAQSNENTEVELTEEEQKEIMHEAIEQIKKEKNYGQDSKTVRDVYNTLNEDQKMMVFYLIKNALKHPKETSEENNKEIKEVKKEEKLDKKLNSKK